MSCAGWGYCKRLFFAGFVSAFALGGCARLPYTTQVVHEDKRVSVKLQREVEPAAYSHPVSLTSQQVESLLRPFSLREKQRLPLRWFAEETPPQKIFREDEIRALAPHLAEALQRAGSEERVYFLLLAPGLNPRYRQDVTGGWIAVRDRFLHLTIDYFHVQQPVEKADAYDYNYPTPWTPPKSYLLYFEPGRFYVTDPQTDTRGVELQEFLRTIPSP